jgi:ABC-2 type transport system ATP-binding protein
MPAASGYVKLRALPRDGAAIAGDVAAALNGNQLPVSEMFVEQGKLDEVFREITSHEAERQHA